MVSTSIKSSSPEFFRMQLLPITNTNCPILIFEVKTRNYFAGKISPVELNTSSSQHKRRVSNSYFSILHDWGHRFEAALLKA